MANVAVVDIGSNSIKVLVATRDHRNQVVALYEKAMEVSISSGINADKPMLQKENMVAGLKAIQALIASTKAFYPHQTQLVATSEVRDAINGSEFCILVKENTGHTVRILTGAEEANGIGRGLLCDPALATLKDFTLFDLGGGSLECLTFRNRQIEQAISLPLGCVRLTEKFLPDAHTPISEHTRNTITAYTLRALQDAGLGRQISGSHTIATGGSVISIRSINAAQLGASIAGTSSQVSRKELHELFGTFIGHTLSVGINNPGLSKTRSDVFPAAIATLLGVTEYAAVDVFHHSFYNLRYGMAAAALADI